MSIKLSKEAEQDALASLARYAHENFDEPIGGLALANLLDYLLAELGPVIYNQAIKDAQTALQARVMDLDIDCHQEEFVYWRKKGRG